MIKITVSEYLNSKGEKEFQAFYNAEPICKNSKDEQFVSTYANSVYHQQRKAVLTKYNSITNTDTIIEAKGYTKNEMKKLKLWQ